MTQYDKWTVLDANGAKWLCRCDCGTERSVSKYDLIRGKSKNCGCVKKAKIAARNRAGATHGKTNTPEFRAWTMMKSRCYDKNQKAYKDWGGRGITVCERWRESFENFLADMGPRPSAKHSIDRYPDNDGNYEPTNCRWATVKEQGRNRRDNHLVTFSGKTLTVVEWSELTGIAHRTLVERLKRLPPEQALTEPLR